jgi:carbon storage regulator
MLVLTRNIGESIVIGEKKEKVTVTLLNIKGTQAKIGIDAPRKIPVHRIEIYNKIQENAEKE